MTDVDKISLWDNDENAQALLLDRAIKVDICLVPSGNNTILEEYMILKKISTLGPDLDSTMA